jgi:hypothetical protein
LICQMPRGRLPKIVHEIPGTTYPSTLHGAQLMLCWYSRHADCSSCHKHQLQHGLGTYAVKTISHLDKRTTCGVGITVVLFLSTAMEPRATYGLAPALALSLVCLMKLSCCKCLLISPVGGQGAMHGDCRKAEGVQATSSFANPLHCPWR